MEALVTLTAVAVPVEGSNIDTDRIIPARLLRNPRDAERTYAGALFHDVRFRDDGSEVADFVLNQPAYRDARILVSDANFGCGSSRESAVYALFDYGFRVIIAPSFGDIFYSNCVRNGVAPLRISADQATRLRESLRQSDTPVASVDINALTITGPDGHVYDADLPGFQQQVLLQGLDEVGATLEKSEAIAAFERDYKQARPWLNRSGDATTGGAS